MRRLFLSVLLALVAASVASAFDFKNETLTYKVEYKWGLINKTAGSVTMKLNNKNDRYSCVLTASSAGWADKFYKVRDTLTCDIVRDGFRPVYYSKKSHEGGDDKHESVTYSYNGNTVTGNCTRKKWKDGKLVTDDPKVLTAEGVTLDIFSAFYYMRHLPYATWHKGQVLKTNIFSGKRKETLTIKYDGVETIKVGKSDYECYHIKFMFTSKGGKKSSDDIDAWISVADNHIPIKLEGSLPIGKIRCFYTGAK